MENTNRYHFITYCTYDEKSGKHTMITKKENVSSFDTSSFKKLSSKDVDRFKKRIQDLHDRLNKSFNNEN
jgi:hypothetical protein